MDKFEKVLDIIDHQDKYSDEEVREILQDEECRKLYQTMQEVDSALLDGELKTTDSEDRLDVDMEWQKFDKAHPVGSGAALSWRKMAASFVGFLLVSGIAFATIHFVYKSHDTGRVSPDEQNKEVVMGDSTKQEAPDSLLNVRAEKPAVHKTFVNVALDKMISEIVAYYDMQVRFDNADTKKLRLYYDWDSRLGIVNVIKELNQFENVNIAVSGQTVVVK